MSSTMVTTKMPSELLIGDMTAAVKHFFEERLVRFSARRTW